MPTYHSPPPTPPASPPPSNSKSRSRSHSHSYSSSPSRPRSDITEDTRADSLIKTSLLFLGSVAAATFCAHKFWPKGITYGEKEEWEMEKKVQKAKRELRDEKQRARRDDGRGSPSGGYGNVGRDERRARYREGGRSSGYAAREDEYPSRERSRNRSRGSSRDRGSDFDRGDRERGMSRDRYGERRLSRDPGDWERGAPRDRRAERRSSRDYDDGEMIERRASKREPSYYPPQPQRYAIDRSGSTSGSRRSSLDRSRSRRYYDDDAEPEPQYVYREPPPRSRRVSVDGGYDRRRYDDDRAYY